MWCDMVFYGVRSVVYSGCVCTKRFISCAFYNHLSRIQMKQSFHRTCFRFDSLPLCYYLNNHFFSLLFSFSVHCMHTGFVAWPGFFQTPHYTTVANTIQYNTDRADMGIGPKVWGEDRLCGAPVRGRIPPTKKCIQGLPRLLLDDPGPGRLRPAPRGRTQSQHNGSRDCLWG